MALQQTLDGDGIAIQLFHHLAKRPARNISVEETALHFKIPDTVVFSNFPVAWYHWGPMPHATDVPPGKTQPITRDQTPLDSVDSGSEVNIPIDRRTKTNRKRISAVQGEIRVKSGKDLERGSILEAFCSNRPAGADAGDIVASFLGSGVDGGETTVVEFLNEQGLQDFLNEPPGRTGLLQRFVVPPGPRNEVIQAVWSPGVTHIDKRVNRYKLNDRGCTRNEKAITYEGAAHYTQQGVIAQHTKTIVTDICKSIVDHFKSVEHHYSIARMVLYFKEARRDGGCLWLMFGSSFRVNEMRFHSNKPPLNLTPQFRIETTQGAAITEEERLLLAMDRPHSAPPKAATRRAVRAPLAEMEERVGGMLRSGSSGVDGPVGVSFTEEFEDAALIELGAFRRRKAADDNARQRRRLAAELRRPASESLFIASQLSRQRKQMRGVLQTQGVERRQYDDTVEGVKRYWEDVYKPPPPKERPPKPRRHPKLPMGVRSLKTTQQPPATPPTNTPPALPPIGALMPKPVEPIVTADGKVVDEDAMEEATAKAMLRLHLQKRKKPPPPVAPSESSDSSAPPSPSSFGSAPPVGDIPMASPPASPAPPPQEQRSGGVQGALQKRLQKGLQMLTGGSKQQKDDRSAAAAIRKLLAEAALRQAYIDREAERIMVQLQKSMAARCEAVCDGYGILGERLNELMYGTYCRLGLRRANGRKVYDVFWLPPPLPEVLPAHCPDLLESLNMKPYHVLAEDLERQRLEAAQEEEEEAREAAERAAKRGKSPGSPQSPINRDLSRNASAFLKPPPQGGHPDPPPPELSEDPGDGSVLYSVSCQHRPGLSELGRFIRGVRQQLVRLAEAERDEHLQHLRQHVRNTLDTGLLLSLHHHRRGKRR